MSREIIAMLTFFRGWHRKIGVVSLVIACVLAAGWARSLVMSDVVLFPCLARQQVVYCGHGGIVWTGYPRSGLFEAAWNHSSAPTANQNIENMDMSRLDVRVPADAGWRVWRFHFWSIVIPPTLLSAYLLLRMPRVAISPASTTAPNEAQVPHA